jgi:hypothetical protein
MCILRLTNFRTYDKNLKSQVSILQPLKGMKVLVTLLIEDKN